MLAIAITALVKLAVIVIVVVVVATVLIGQETIIHVYYMNYTCIYTYTQYIAYM